MVNQKILPIIFKCIQEKTWMVQEHLLSTVSKSFLINNVYLWAHLVLQMSPDSATWSSISHIMINMADITPGMLQALEWGFRSRNIQRQEKIFRNKGKAPQWPSLHLFLSASGEGKMHYPYFRKLQLTETKQRFSSVCPGDVRWKHFSMVPLLGVSQNCLFSTRQ